MNKRGYFVTYVNGSYGAAIVASSVKEAKQIAYKHADLGAGDADVPWIDMRATWCKDADVGSLPMGVINDLRDGLLCGILTHIEIYPCDRCGNESTVYAHDGKALCGTCLSKRDDVPEELKKMFCDW